MKGRAMTIAWVILALALTLFGAFLFFGTTSGWVKWTYERHVDNDPFAKAELVERVEDDGLIILKSGERIRIQETPIPENLGLEGLVGLIYSRRGVTGNVRDDVRTSDWKVEVERLGKDPDGATSARVQVRVNCENERGIGDIDFTILRIPLRCSGEKPRFDLRHLYIKR